MKNKDTVALAERHGLQIKDDVHFNEMGLYFRMGFARDLAGEKWVLRIPRRPDLGERIEQEKTILNLAREYLSVAVPDWKIISDELVAYPLLEDPPVLEFDANTYEVNWNIDPEDSNYEASMAKVLAGLHQIPEDLAVAKGLKSVTIDMARQEILDNINTVKRELGIGADLEKRGRQWADNDALWPDFTVFVHGDLYAGHVLSKNNGEITGIIDWSEGQINDPSVDFSGHMAAFGGESLKTLIAGYEQEGGKVWDSMFPQTVERHAAAPLKYAVFAITVNSDTHIAAVKDQLGLG